VTLHRSLKYMLCTNRCIENESAIAKTQQYVNTFMYNTRNS